MNKKTLFCNFIVLSVGLIGGVVLYSYYTDSYVPNKSSTVVNTPVISPDVLESVPTPSPSQEEHITESTKPTVEEEVNAYLNSHLGSAFPEISYIDEKGIDYSTNNLKGQPYVIHFVDVGCDSCLDIIQNSQQVKNVLPTLLIADVNALDVLEQFKEEHNFTTYDFYLRKQEETYASQLDLDYYPTTFLIDKDGMIAQIFIGNFDAETMIDVITSTLGTNTSND